MTTPRLWRIEGSQLVLAFHRGQARAWRSKRRIVAVISGTQGGKTTFGPHWLYRELQDRGPGDYIAATASYDLFKLKMLPAIRETFEQLHGCGRYWSGDKIMEIADPERGFLAQRADDPMYARIILRSASAPGGLEAATAQAAWLDEAGQDEFTLEAWEAVLRRLAISRGRILITTTPYNMAWLKTEVYDRWADGDTDIDVIQFPSTTNPAFPGAEFERAERTMQPWRFAMFYRARFTQPAGLIYGAFTDALLVDPFPIPPEWERVVGLDPGGANCATVYLAQDPATRTWYVYAEDLRGGETTADYAGAIVERLAGAEARVVGGSSSEGQVRRDFAAAGVYVQEPAIADVEPGIDRVTALWKAGMRVFRDLHGLRDELGSYRRKLDAQGNPQDEIVDKRKFHRLDALRYAATCIEGDQWLIS